MSVAVSAAPGAPVTHLLYLHGFRSSPQSTKAHKFSIWVASHRPEMTWLCPQLDASPARAMSDVEVAIASWPNARMAVIGSSLGGFYATVVAERHGCRAVVLNPAIDPARDLAKAIGQTTAWHSDEPFVFRPEYVEELRAMTPGPLTDPGRYFAVVAKGDEVLSWREMSVRYAGSPICLLEGSDHALTDFDDQMPEVLDFLGLSASSR